MTADTGVADAQGTAAQSAAAGRRAREMDRWRRRSRRVGFYRGVLPWVMLLIVVAIVGWMALRAFRDSRGTPPPQATELTMNAPKFYGRDEKGRSFQLEAKQAIRSSGNETEAVTLIEPGMRLEMGGEEPMVVAGGRGVYREAANSLLLDGGVRMKDGRGTDLASPEAVVDTKAGVVRGQKGVTGTGPLGRVTASSYAIYDGGERAVFSGGVRSHIEKK